MTRRPGRGLRRRRGRRAWPPPGMAGRRPRRLQHDLVQRVLDDPLRAGQLQPRNQIAHGALLDDRVHRRPSRRRSAAEMVGRCSAGSRPSTVARSARRTFSIRPTRPCASIAALSSSAMFSQLGLLPRVGERGLVGNQLGVRLHDRVEDAEPVGAQRRSGFGHLDDRVGQHRRLDLGRAPGELHRHARRRAARSSGASPAPARSRWSCRRDRPPFGSPSLRARPAPSAPCRSSVWSRSGRRSARARRCGRRPASCSAIQSWPVSPASSTPSDT